MLILVSAISKLLVLDGQSTDFPKSDIHTTLALQSELRLTLTVTSEVPLE